MNKILFIFLLKYFAEKDVISSFNVSKKCIKVYIKNK